MQFSPVLVRHDLRSPAPAAAVISDDFQASPEATIPGPLLQLRTGDSCELMYKQQSKEPLVGGLRVADGVGAGWSSWYEGGAQGCRAHHGEGERTEQ